MTLKKRLRQVASVSLVSLALASAAQAEGAGAGSRLRALSAEDAQHYALAFSDCDRGDFIDAAMQASAIKDPSLEGYISFSQLMHPTAHKASFDELAGWLAKFRELPLADRVFALASKRKPAGEIDPPMPAVTVDWVEANGVASPVQRLSPKAQRAREAYFSGDVRRAHTLAVEAGDRWIQGLSAWRLKAFDEAQGAFAELAADTGADAWTRSAAAFWSARSAQALGDSVRAAAQLQAAAQNPATFYGMIAARELKLARIAAPDGDQIAHLLMQASFVQPVRAAAPAAEVLKFTQADPRAHRAAALAQIGRIQDAARELRAGLALARTSEEKANWQALADQLGAVSAVPAAPEGSVETAADEDFPTPLLQPKEGFTLDRALVYAIVRQESRFNPMAVSAKGAVGLMQVMPASAAQVAGDDKLRSDASPLFDAATNLRVGQDYVTWLMEHFVGYDLLHAVAAYNGGPGMVAKTVQTVGDDDPFLFVESLPAAETRGYVQRVMAGYWTYKQMFGDEVKSLDALASGARVVDARLDLKDALSPGSAYASQTLQVGTD